MIYWLGVIFKLLFFLGSVGKNALIKQFQTSEYNGTYDVANQTRNDPNDGVVIALDGIESLLTFVSMDIDMVNLLFFLKIYLYQGYDKDSD